MSNNDYRVGVTWPTAEPGPSAVVTSPHDGTGEAPRPIESAPAEVPAAGQTAPRRKAASLVRRASVAWIAAALALFMAATLATGFMIRSGSLSSAQGTVHTLRAQVLAATEGEHSLRGQISDLQGRIGDVENSVGKCQSAVKLDDQYKRAVDDMLTAAAANNRPAVEAAIRRAGDVYDRMTAANSVCLDQPGPEASTA